MARDDHDQRALGTLTPHLGRPRSDRVVGQTAALFVGAALTASLALARGNTWSRALGLISVTVVIVAVFLRATARPLGRHARDRARPTPPGSRGSNQPGGRRQRRRSFMITSLGLLALVAILIIVGWWAAFFIIPGVLVGVGVTNLRRRQLAFFVTRPQGGWLVVLLVPLLVVGWSVETTLAAPGQDPSSVRMVEWLRDHGGANIVDSVEQWWYTNHPPPVGGTPKELRRNAGPAVSSTTRAIDGSNSVPLLRVASPAGNAIGNEGIWAPLSGSANRPAVATTLLRPDAVHTSLVVGLLRIDPSQVRLRLMAGTDQPDGNSPNNGTVLPSDLDHLLAAFNAGFRLSESNGGWFSEGHSVSTLRPGAASLVLRDDGHADVGVWGRDDNIDAHVLAVRQNLALIVDHGAAVPGLDSPNTSLWGKTLGNKLLVWRSGIGVTSTGILVYAGGPGLSVGTLARTLMAAGSVRAMELDINTQWVDAYTFHDSPTGPVGTKLVDLMRYGPDRYLRPQSRDFVAVMAK